MAGRAQHAAVAAALVLVACGGAAPADVAAPAPASAAVPAPSAEPDDGPVAQPREPELHRYAEAVAALFEALAAEVSAAGADCERAARAMDAWLDEHGEEWSALARRGRELPARDLVTVEARVGERLEAAKDALVARTRACEDSAAIRAAAARFDALE
jgi:hypothetical protein